MPSLPQSFLAHGYFFNETGTQPFNLVQYGLPIEQNGVSFILFFRLPPLYKSINYCIRIHKRSHLSGWHTRESS